MSFFLKILAFFMLVIISSFAQAEVEIKKPIQLELEVALGEDNFFRGEIPIDISLSKNCTERCDIDFDRINSVEIFFETGLKKVGERVRLLGINQEWVRVPDGIFKYITLEARDENGRILFSSHTKMNLNSIVFVLQHNTVRETKLVISGFYPDEDHQKVEILFENGDTINGIFTANKVVTLHKILSGKEVFYKSNNWDVDNLPVLFVIKDTRVSYDIITNPLEFGVEQYTNIIVKKTFQDILVSLPLEKGAELKYSENFPAGFYSLEIQGGKMEVQVNFTQVALVRNKIYFYSDGINEVELSFFVNESELYHFDLHKLKNLEE